MSDPQSDNQQFQPGQLGLKHLLGVMATVSVVAALSAARLRTLPAMRAGEVVVHWLLVALVAGAFYYSTSLRRRRERLAAGPLILRVAGRPMTEARRQVISWLLVCAVVVDGVVMSVVVLPTGILLELVDSPFVLLWMLCAQGLLWRYCLDHWLTNVYSVEFCENGVLTYGKYFPWQNTTRIVWSPAQPANLVIGSGGYIHEVTIEPAARAAVSELLASRAAAKGPSERPTSVAAV
jgi:hypothetical protein